MEMTTVLRTHSCRYNSKHRLEKGMRRLTIKEGRYERHYCLSCAKIFLKQGLDRIQVLLTEIEK